MAIEGPLERLVEKIGQHLSRVLDAFEGLLSEIGLHLWTGVKRTGRFVLRMLRQGLKNLSYLLRLASIFLALLWIGSGCFELTYLDSLILKALGWMGTVFVAAIILAGMVVFLRPGVSEKYSDQRAHTIKFLLIHMIALVVLSGGIYCHYEFHSPVLKWAQSSLASGLLKVATLETPRKPAGAESYSTEQKITPRIYSRWEMLKNWISGSPPASETPPLVVAVKCKGDDDTTWAKASDTQLNMWVEDIRLTEKSTILDMAAKTWFPTTTGDLRKATGAYFVDDEGVKYQLEDDNGDYTLFDGTHTCKGDEIYRFQLLFPKLTHRSAYIYLHHPQFERLEVDLDWQGVPLQSRH